MLIILVVFTGGGEGGQQEKELAEQYRAWAKQLHFDYPFVGGIIEGIAASYDREAIWHDSDAEIDKRLPGSKPRRR